MKEKNNPRTRGMEPISPELVAAAKAGSKAAFAELYEQTYAMLYRTIRSMVKDEDLTWDILQDSYIRAYKGLNKLENNAAFLPWLRRIAVNLIANQLAQKPILCFSDLAWEDGQQPEIPDPDPDTQPEQAMERKESSRRLRELLASLPKAQLLILGMRYYEDMTIREIAEALQLAPGTVKSQLYRGRKRIEAGIRAMEKREGRDRRSA